MSTAQVTSVFSARETMTRTLNSIESSTRRLDRAFGSLRGRMRSAIEFNVVNRGMDMMWRGIHRLTSAIPDLIRRGEQWAATVDAITDATGMSARQASELAAVNQRVGGSNEALTRGLAAMAKSVYTSRDSWKDMGVAVALNRDGSVDAYRTFQNLRGAISATGGSLLSTAAAQNVLSRSGKDLLDLLQLTPRQYRMLARDARNAGQVMSDAAVKAAENWQNAQKRFGTVMDGLGTKILTGLAPVLTRFVDGFSDFVERNMDSLVRLVVGGANTILTVVGDLLGIDLGKWSFTEKVANAGKDAEKGGKGLKDFSAATKAATKSTRDHNTSLLEQARLQKELRQAQAAVARERGRSALFSRMSGVDAELWRQQKAARIKDAQVRVRDAQKAIAEHRKTMDTMAAQAAKAGADIRDSVRLDGKGGGPKKKGGGKGGGVFGDVGSIIKESTKTGHQIAGALKDAIFGPATLGMKGGMVVTVRQGGLIGALQGVQKWLQDVSGWLTKVSGGLGALQPLLSNAGPLVLAIAALKLGGGGGLPVFGPPAPGGKMPGWGSMLAWLGIATADSGPLRDYMPGTGAPGLQRILDEALHKPSTGGTANNGGSGRKAASFRDYLNRGQGYTYPLRGPAMGQSEGETRPISLAAWRAIRSRNPFGFDGSSGSVFGGLGGGLSSVGSFGVNPLNYIGLDPLSGILRRYLGPTAPLVTGQDDQTSALGGIYGASETTAGNTQAVADGQVGVSNPAFPDIGTIKNVKGNLPVESGKTLTVWTPGGKKLPTEGGGGKGGHIAIEWGSTGGQIRKTATWTETTARRMQYGDYSAGRLLFDIRTAVNKMAGIGPGSSSVRP